MSWEKITLSKDFISESCCLCDVDGDGELEVVAGDSWWKFESITKRNKFRDVDCKWLPVWPHDPSKDPHPHLREASGLPPEYRADTYDWAYDLTGNGCQDIIWVGMHKDPVCWCENTGDYDRQWPVHKITEGGIYESVIFTDKIISNKPSLITIPKKHSIAWYEPEEDIRSPWKEHIIGNEGGDWHGLGAGDINQDGKIEIICKNFIYIQNDNPREIWKRKKLTQLLEDGTVQDGLGDIFIVEVVTIPGISRPVLISASPHKKGMWWWTFEDENAEKVIYRRHSIQSSTSQLHAIQIVNNRKTNIPSIISGKRWQAHGVDGDVDPHSDPVLLCSKFSESENIFQSEVIIDSDSGVGIKFDTAYDHNDQLLVAVSNKNGLYVFKQINGDFL